MGPGERRVVARSVLTGVSGRESERREVIERAGVVLCMSVVSVNRVLTASIPLDSDSSRCVSPRLQSFTASASLPRDRGVCALNEQSRSRDAPTNQLGFEYAEARGIA